MAASLTAELLTFSRKNAVNPELLLLNDAVRRVESLLRRVFPTDRKLVIDLCHEDPWVRIDPSHLHLIVLNLALNARDVLPVGGRLTISTSPPRMDAEGREWTTVTATDNGSGMDPETAALVFDPFFTTKAGGTGLGLATVREVVEHAGGSIELTTVKGEGTTFTVSFPCHRVEGDAVKATASAQGSTNTRSIGQILVVEDTVSVGRLLEEVLEHRGHHVRWCKDGQEAVTATEELIRDGTPPQVVICDVVLPGQRGPALLQKLRELQPDLAAVLTSGYRGEDTPDLGSLDERVVFLPKPFSPDDLWAALYRVARESGAGDGPA